MRAYLWLVCVCVFFCVPFSSSVVLVLVRTVSKTNLTGEKRGNVRTVQLHIIDTGGKDVDCGKLGMAGPTVSGDATLRCDGIKLVGDLTDTISPKNGITLEDNAVVEDCVVENFTGAGYVFANGGKKDQGTLKTLVNSKAKNVGSQGVSVASSGTNNIINVEADNSFNQGIFVRPNAGEGSL